jgi:chaperone BCS1
VVLLSGKMASPFLLAQQVFTAFTNKPNPCINTNAANGTIFQDEIQPGSSFPTDLTSLITFLLSFSALSDWFKLIVLGSLLETCRRLTFHFYYKLYNSFFITATFEEDDSSYGMRNNIISWFRSAYFLLDWMMVWLSSQSFWSEFYCLGSRFTTLIPLQRASPGCPN